MSKLARRKRRFSGASDVRGFGGLAELPLLPIAVGLGVLAVIMNKDSIVSAAQQVETAAFDFAKGAAFKAALPSNVGQYASQILAAAQQYGVDPFALAAIMYNESRGGVATGYTPQGPGGTGDFVRRSPSSPPPAGKLPSPVGDTGWVQSGYAKYANPATGLPPDGLGWGRGLMQIDYGANNAWVIANPWWDAQTNINKAAEIYATFQRVFQENHQGQSLAIEQWRVTTGKPQTGYNIQPWAAKYPGHTFMSSVPDPRPLYGQQLVDATIASYNAGTSGPLQAIASGLPAEAVTANQNYVSKFLALVPGWRMAYDKLAGNA